MHMLLWMTRSTSVKMDTYSSVYRLTVFSQEPVLIATRQWSSMMYKSMVSTKDSVVRSNYKLLFFGFFLVILFCFWFLVLVETPEKKVPRSG